MWWLRGLCCRAKFDDGFGGCIHGAAGRLACAKGHSTAIEALGKIPLLGGDLP